MNHYGQFDASFSMLTIENQIIKCLIGKKLSSLYEIDFDPDCTQTNSGKANVWTDFKVNEVSKKFQHSNIFAFDCGSK
ncbi:hypothetical protein EF405_15870 [Cyclobacteriaceae bacterium YHN15]|nr:hypothetical protein EF405_15870 [Cyclobacteriaceae bacterium YHN15]